jgi:DNA-binding beta-propeller fold protein YncE
VFYSGANKRLQVVTGLPDGAQLTADIDTSTLPEAPGMAAVSDDGATVLVASSETVYRIAAGQAPATIFSGTQIRSLVVLRSGTEAAVADAGTASVFVLSGLDGALSSRLLAAELDQVAQLYPSPDGATLFACMPGARAISWIDLASGAVQTAEADLPPAGLIPLRNRDTFLISAHPRQPGLIFYREGNAGRMVFVPAASETPEASQ